MNPANSCNLIISSVMNTLVFLDEKDLRKTVKMLQFTSYVYYLT